MSDLEPTLPAPPPPGGGFVAPPAPGARFGRYRLVRELGRGGQGVVFLAEDAALGRRVAIKVLTGRPAPSSAALERFRREAAVTARLDHPGVCPVYDVGVEAGDPYLAMRYVEGRTLARLLADARDAAEPSPETAAEAEGGGSRPTRAGPRTPSDSRSRAEVLRRVAWIERAARALHAAHEAGVVHRDVKPGNLMITESGDVVVLDFGLAQELDAEQPALTLTGDVVGTPPYLAPEQLADAGRPLDRRVDVWALGVALYECATLARPFRAPTREALYRAILSEDPPDLRAANPAAPADLAVVVATALEKNRDRRYATALDLAEDLRRVLAREPILARRAGPFLRLRRFAERNPLVAAAAVVVVLLLAASLALLVGVVRERDAKIAALADYERLGDATRLAGLVAEAENLWPAEPSILPAAAAWLRRAEALAERLAGHAATVDRLRADATRDAAASRPTTEPGASDDANRFRLETLARLVEDLRRFVDPDPRRGVLASVRTRVAFASDLTRRSLEKPARAWAEASAEIADVARSPRYGGLVLEPILGLVPLGRDPASGLHEFHHLATAAPGYDAPVRGADGRLDLTADAGLVLVLVPGGTFLMGAAPPRPPDDEDDEDEAETASSRPASRPSYDPDARDDEAPVRPVVLEPYFLAKHEMTQAQWLRATGSNPSTYGDGWKFAGRAVNGRHPVETVSYAEALRTTARLGLALPTEAQWEFAARAGTDAPWWTGPRRDALADAENLADIYCRDHGGHPSWTYEPWDDGAVVHAPAGSYRPNPLGFHDLLGNVAEWCRDPYGFYDDPTRAGDGLRITAEGRGFVNRGGAFSFVAVNARTTARSRFAADHRDAILGLRPSRPLRRP